MFKIDLPRVGCGQKIPQSFLAIAAGLIGRDSTTDASFHYLPDGSGVLISIDKVGRFSEDLETFVRLSVRHCVGDILAERGLPIAASVCIEAGPEIASPEELAELTALLRLSCDEHGLQLGNLHSIRSEYTALTISVLGAASPQRIAAPPRTGSVYLTGRLGAFKSILLHEVEGRSIDKVVAEVVDRRVRSWPESLFTASDVTGFGLSGTLYNISQRHGIRISVDLSPSICISEEVFQVPMACTDSKSGCWELPDSLVGGGRIVMNCTELAGPFVALCSDNHRREFEDEFLRVNGFSPVWIGVFEAGFGGGAELKWIE